MKRAERADLSTSKRKREVVGRTKKSGGGDGDGDDGGDVVGVVARTAGVGAGEGEEEHRGLTGN